MYYRATLRDMLATLPPAGQAELLAALNGYDTASPAAAPAAPTPDPPPP